MNKYIKTIKELADKNSVFACLLFLHIIMAIAAAMLAIALLAFHTHGAALILVPLGLAYWVWREHNRPERTEGSVRIDPKGRDHE